MQYNMRNPAVKRILQEAKELQDDPQDDFVACPLEDDIFEWHFTLRGPPDTEFEGGQYHGRILLEPEYPMKPPSIIMLTPSGRFQVHQKICLSVTGYHPEFWRPAWGIRTVCMALLSIFPAAGDGAIGALDASKEDRRVDARRSRDFVCPQCEGNELMVLPTAPRHAGAPKTADLDGFQLSFAYEKKPAVATEASASTDAVAGSASASTAPQLDSSSIADLDAVPSQDGDDISKSVPAEVPAAPATPPQAAVAATPRRRQPKPQQASSWTEIFVVSALFFFFAFLLSKVAK